MPSLSKKEKHQLRTYLSSSEFCSGGHPDRLCDCLAAIVINDIQKTDGPNSHAAIEVFATHDTVTFGGEATTTLELSDEYLKKVVEKGFARCGYLPEMRKFWTKEEVALAEDVTIFNKIAAQSPDIAMGTTDLGEESGFNDQGIFFSSAENTNDKRIGTVMLVAQTVCEHLHNMSRASIVMNNLPIHFGPDNKCVATVKVASDGFTPIEITAITIAVAHDSASSIEFVRDFVKESVTSILKDLNIPISESCQWVINGTGRFVVHGIISDCSMTGRKISVNHPSAGPVWCNKMIGGGSLVKPAHASDLILNLTSRFIASVVVKAGLSKYAVVGCSGAIGQTKIQSIFIKGDDEFDRVSLLHKKVEEFFVVELPWAPIRLAQMFGIFDDSFDFSRAVNKNFFGDSETQPWEGTLVDEWADKLNEFLS